MPSPSMRRNILGYTGKGRNPAAMVKAGLARRAKPSPLRLKRRCRAGCWRCASPSATESVPAAHAGGAHPRPSLSSEAPRRCEVIPLRRRAFHKKWPHEHGAETHLGIWPHKSLTSSGPLKPQVLATANAIITKLESLKRIPEPATSLRLSRTVGVSGGPARLGTLKREVGLMSPKSHKSARICLPELGIERN